MAEIDKKGTLAGVIEAAAADAAPSDAEQLDFLPIPTRASLTDSETARIDAAVKRDRAGRPKGARNKTTREMLDFVRKTMGDPLMRRFQYAEHTPESLAIELGCTRLEAFDRLDRMWAELARFFYAQQAPTDGQGNAVAPRLTVVFGGQNAPQIGPGGAPRAPWMYLDGDPQPNAEMQQNQALLAPGKTVSDAVPGVDTE